MIPIMIVFVVFLFHCPFSALASPHPTEVLHGNRMAYAYRGTAAILTNYNVEDGVLMLDLDPILNCTYPTIKAAFLESCGQNPDVDTPLPTNAPVRFKKFVPALVIGGIILVGIAVNVGISVGVFIYASSETQRLQSMAELQRNETRFLFEQMTAAQRLEMCEIGGLKAREEFLRQFPDQNGLTHFDKVSDALFEGAYKIQLSHCEVGPSYLKADLKIFYPRFDFIGSLYETTHLGQLIRNKTRLIKDESEHHRMVIFGENGERRTVDHCKRKEGPKNGFFDFECEEVKSSCDPVTLDGCNTTNTEVNATFVELERIGRNVIIRSSINEYRIKSNRDISTHTLESGIALITCKEDSEILVGEERAKCRGSHHYKFPYFAELTEFERAAMARIEEEERAMAEYERSFEERKKGWGDRILSTFIDFVKSIFENPIKILLTVIGIILSLIALVLACQCWCTSRSICCCCPDCKKKKHSPLRLFVMVEVKVIDGIVQDQSGDFIVCEVDENFHPLKGSGEVIWDQAGVPNLENLRTTIPLVDYQIRKTESFNLSDNYSQGILHLKVPSFSSLLFSSQADKNEKLKKCYLSILRKAVEEEAKSIVMPFIGIVCSKFSKKDGTALAMETISEFCSSNEKQGKLEEIIFLCYDNEKTYNFATTNKLFINQQFGNKSLHRQDCYYRVNSPGQHETNDRLRPFDLKNTSCGDKKQLVKDFIMQFEGEVNLHGCTSTLELLNIQANGEPESENNQIELESRMICENHFHELVVNWELSDPRHKNRRQSRNSADRNVQCPLYHKTPAESDIRRVVDKSMCLHYLRREGILVPPGTTVCKRHQSIMKTENTKFRKPNDMEIDPTERFPIEEASADEMFFDDSGMIISAVSQLVQAIGGDRVLTRGEWSGLAEKTKKKKGYLTKRIIEAVCEVITPDGKEDLYERATSEIRPKNISEIAGKMIDNIDERFAIASSTQEKVELLSLASDLGLSAKEIMSCIPSASLHYLNLAKTFNKGGLDFDKSYIREKMDEKKINYFEDFLVRSNALVILPWGDTLATRSDGTKTPIASKNGRQDMKISRGSATRMLKAIAKRKNERMTCVDEYAVDAYEGWRQLTAVVEELRETHGLIEDVDEKSLKQWIRISKAHLEGDYFAEVTEGSNIPQHCIRFSLSDTSRKYFAEDCAHEHDGVCPHCNQLDLLLCNLKSLTKRLTDEAEASNSINHRRIERLMQIVNFSCDNIEAYQAHVLRSAHSSNSKAKIMDGLENGHCLLTLDFAMKVIPEKAVEGQSDFFGKKGISLHISHALAKIDGKMVDHSFAHTLDDVKQNSALILAIVRHVLEILEKKGITVVTIRSDNAGAYKCSKLISSFHFLSTPKLIINGYYFSESQAGKGPCDRTTSHCKRKTGEWTSSENNIGNAHNIFEALTVENETIRGLSTYYCTFSNTASKIPNVFPGIQSCFSFDFEADGVRSRGQYGIGEGLLTKKSKLSFLNCSLDVVEEGGHIGESFWNSLEKNDSDEKKEIALEENNEDRDDEMYHCSTLGCKRTFRTIRWLNEHEMNDKHDYGVKRRTMVDKAIDKFKELIETRDAARVAVTEQVEAIGNNGVREAVKMGWGLKSSHPTYPLFPTARDQAQEYFNSQRSLNPPRRADPAVMRKRLLQEMDPIDPTGRKYLYEYHQIPSEKQLFSLFTRLETNRKNPKKTTTARSSAKISKSTTSKVTKKSTRAKSSVRSTAGGSRKRKVMKEPEEESELDDDVFMNGSDEEEDSDVEYLKMDEGDFIRRVIEEERDEIFD